MKLSQLIATLVDAKDKFGDVPVKLMDPDTGSWDPVFQVIKLHPFTLRYGFMNRNEPVYAIALVRHPENAADLVLDSFI